ncbi:MtrAB system accessory lipoprotein LpqB [soil metagenome]
MRSPVPAALAAALVLVLAGCVGIPTSGGVNDGDIIDDQAVPEFVVLPSDPVPGSTQEQILSDFMQAVSSPQGGYAVAKKYLTSTLAATWNPDASAIIRTGPFSTEFTDPDSMTFSFTSRASVNELGQYQEERDLSNQTLTFSFQQEDGEWRISAAADGIVLSQSAFNIAFREQALYFFDPSYGYLVPDVRWFPARQTSSLRVVQALLAGPSSWLQQAVTTAFPEATKLGEITVQTGSTVVDLSTEALASTPQDRDRMRQQLVATLDTPNVALTVRGLELPTPDATGDRASVNPRVDPAVLVGLQGNEFGFAGVDGIAPINGITPQVVAGGAVAADLAADKQTVAFLDGSGAVFVALAGDSEPTLIAPGPGWTAPSVDPFRFVWSAQGDNASTLTSWEVDATAHPISSGLAADSSIVSLDVSRDGSRILLLLATPVGPRLAVAGIVRQDHVPVALGELVELPIGAQSPLDATWVDDRTVAAVSVDEEGTAGVTAFEIGGPSLSLGTVLGARSIVGGNGGTDGLRVLAADGSVWRPRGSEGWVATGVSASFLATKQ